MSNRLPNQELNYYEDMIADTIAIGRACKRLMYWISDDPELLIHVNEVLESAARIKKRTIERRETRKNGA